MVNFATFGKNNGYLKKTFFFKYCGLILTIWCLLPSCNSVYTSKKNGYFKIDFPERKYVSFNKEGFPYSFEYPAYATVVKDSTFFDGNAENPYWINIDFPQFGGKIFLSYKIVGGKVIYKIKQQGGGYKDSVGLNVFDKMVEDAFKLTNKNESVASSIKDSLMHTPNGVTGVFFKVGGNAATAKQFFLSDTLHHFFRGALYFDTTPNADSLKPVQDFLQKDIEHIINSFKWTTKNETIKNSIASTPPLTSPTLNNTTTK
jgi:gliding motility-associated lipoprotein GldD